MRRKCFSILLIISLVVGTMSFASFPAHAATEGKYDYSVDAQGNTVLTKYNGTEQNVVIPDTLGGNPVTVIGASCFYGKTSITSITMPDTIVEVKDAAFYGCTHLQTIDLSDNVIKFGQDVLANTLWIKNQADGMVYLNHIAYGFKGVMPVDTTVNLDPGTKAIAKRAFVNQPNLISISMPAGLVTIGDMSFWDCTGLTTVTMPGSTDTIGSKAFQGCLGLQDIAIPTGVETIGDQAFYQCNKIAEITIPSTVKNFGTAVFGSCTGLLKATVEEGVTSLNSNAFAECSNLVEVKLPSTLTGIENAMFRTCSNLSVINIPTGITYIKETAFQDCASLKAVNLPGGVDTISRSAFQGCASLLSIDIPEGVKSIEDDAFLNCTALATITMPDSINYMGSEVFKGTAWLEAQPDGMIYLNHIAYQCKGYMGITHLSIDPVATIIAGSAFANRFELEQLDVPEGIVSIGPSAFSHCEHAVSLILPYSLKNIDHNAFQGCYLLTDVTMHDGLEEIGNYAFSECSKLPAITIPATVDNTGQYTFNNCNALKTVVLSEGVTKVGDNAFYGCHLLETVTLPSTLKTIGVSAFQSCNRLTGVVFPEGLISIGNSAFVSCSHLTSVQFPKSLKSIGDQAFMFCVGIQYVILQEGIQSIGNSAFNQCNALGSITFPQSLNSVGDGAFFNTIWYADQPDGMIYINKIAYRYKGTMAAATDFSLMPGTIAISRMAFEDCDGLRSLMIPGSVQFLGDDILLNCSNLTTVKIEDGVDTIQKDAFDGIPRNIAVYVPRSVTAIESGNFSSSSSNKMLVYADSFAHQYAVSHLAPFALLVEVYFDSNGGTSIPTIEARSDRCIVEPANPSKTGYALAGWYTDPSLQIPWDFTRMPTVDMILFAKWVPNTYTIMFNQNGGTSGTMSPLAMTYDVSNELTANAYKKSGYALLGWAKTSTGAVAYKDKAIVKNLASANNATVNLYAKWGAPILSAVSYNYNSIKVSWAAAGGATFYKIYRSTSATGTYSLAHTSMSTTRSWIDTGKVTGKYYYYKVYPVAGGTTYKFSTNKYAKAVPSTPTVTLSKYSPTSIKVTWTGVSGASRYQIYRATSATGTYTYLYTASSTARSWVNTGRTIGKTYYYKVRAYHLEGTTKVYGSFSALECLQL